MFMIAEVVSANVHERLVCFRKTSRINASLIAKMVIFEYPNGKRSFANIDAKKKKAKRGKLQSFM